MHRHSWSLQDAKNRFSAVVEAARRGEPQLVTKRGPPAVVVLAAEECARLQALEQHRAPSLVDHLLAIPQDDEAFDRLEVAPPGRRALMYRLDTLVLSELRGSRRDPGLVRWLESLRPTDLYLSVVTIGEVEKGIARQRHLDPAFAGRLDDWLDGVLRHYCGAHSRCGRERRATVGTAR
jgi:antitoxin Phd